jgi:hypothetical protein
MEVGNSSRKKKKQQQHDLELEKVRLISLALDLGFDELAANQCFDRLVSLYGTQSLTISLSFSLN